MGAEASKAHRLREVRDASSFATSDYLIDFLVYVARANDSCAISVP
jgi:hypothetical protein